MVATLVAKIENEDNLVTWPTGKCKIDFGNAEGALFTLSNFHNCNIQQLHNSANRKMTTQQVYCYLVLV